MVESNNEESKGAQQVPAAEEEEKSFLCVKDGRDHGHVTEGTSWREVMTSVGERGEIPSD